MSASSANRVPPEGFVVSPLNPSHWVPAAYLTTHLLRVHANTTSFASAPTSFSRLREAATAAANAAKRDRDAAPPAVAGGGVPTHREQQQQSRPQPVASHDAQQQQQQFATSSAPPSATAAQGFQNVDQRVGGGSGGYPQQQQQQQQGWRAYPANYGSLYGPESAQQPLPPADSSRGGAGHHAATMAPPPPSSSSGGAADGSGGTTRLFIGFGQGGDASRGSDLSQDDIVGYLSQFGRVVSFDIRPMKSIAFASMDTESAAQEILGRPSHAIGGHSVRISVAARQGGAGPGQQQHHQPQAAPYHGAPSSSSSAPGGGVGLGQDPNRLILMLPRGRPINEDAVRHYLSRFGVLRDIDVLPAKSLVFATMEASEAVDSAVDPRRYPDGKHYPDDGSSTFWRINRAGMRHGGPSRGPAGPAMDGDAHHQQHGAAAASAAAWSSSSPGDARRGEARPAVAPRPPVVQQQPEVTELPAGAAAPSPCLLLHNVPTAASEKDIAEAVKPFDPDSSCECVTLVHAPHGSELRSVTLDFKATGGAQSVHDAASSGKLQVAGRAVVGQFA